MEIRRLRELAMKAAHGRDARFSRFLDPALMEEARRAAGACGVECLLYGGYEGAERRMAAFYTDEPPEAGDFPMRAVRIEWNPKFAHPAHRDLLGAVMGLGIERDATGDIALGTYRGKPCAWLFASEEMADYIAVSLTSAGRATVKAQVSDEAPEIAPPEGVTLRVTVQNTRLDAVLAAGCRLSRAEAQRLIAAGLVKLNHAVNLHGDARLKCGDLISARGHGRLRVDALPGSSVRGRQIVMLFKYGG